eukprot:m51a1_g5840 hypothetical protein (388) ;mRNA; f:308734-309977
MAAHGERSRTSIAEQELVVVDGDNALAAVKAMLGMPSYCKRAHVVVCCVRDAPARTVELLERQRGAFASLGVVCARHKVSGAADVNVACIAGAVAARLPLLPLWLVSRDQFVVELCDVLRQLRAAASPSPASSQDEHVRSRESVVACDVGEFIAAHSHCVCAGVPEGSNADGDEGDGQEEKWAPLEAVDRSPATEDELRRTFREEWHGTQAAFCEEFAINRGNFSSWLGGKRSSPASVMAVSRWASQGHRQQPQRQSAPSTPLSASASRRQQLEQTQQRRPAGYGARARLMPSEEESSREDWSHHTHYSKECTEVPRSGSEEALRELYETRWVGTHSEFCRKYEIDQANFSRWRRGLKNSPASAKAVRCWSQSLQQCHSPEAQTERD